MIGLGLPADRLHLLCIGAHPDDVEIGCGGTLLSIAATRNVTATVVVATGIGQRHGEALKSTPRFLPGADVDVTILALPDGRLPEHWGHVKEEFERVAAATPTPDLVFAPRQEDAHQDHRVVAELVHTAWRDSMILRYEVPKWDGDLGRASHYVPLDEDTARRKVELLDECFPSQVGRGWWGEETFLALAKLRGIECRSRFAEAFLVDKAIITLG